MRALGLIALLAAGCGSQADPCANVMGTCLDVHVTGPSDLVVDALRLDAYGAFTGEQISNSTPTGLPVHVGVIPPPGASGSLTLTLDALHLTVVVGRGTATHQLVAGEHATVELPVAATGAGGDGGGMDDLSTPDGFACTAGTPIACVNNDAALQSCNATGDGTDVISCDNGCTATPTPHCKVFTPHTPVTVDLIGGSGAGGAVSVLTSIIKINTDDGTIDNFRPANTNPDATETKQGIVFFRTATMGVFSFNDLTIDTAATVNVVGTRGLALVSSNNIVIKGTLDGRPKDLTGAVCAVASAGPGGFAGGLGGVNSGNGGGAGGGKGPAQVIYGGGGGGGGNGDTARAGGSGNNAANAGGNGGTFTALAYPIVGGSGGGSGSSSNARGGGGGGAIQLVAGKKITIGGFGALVGVNVSGCGGRDGIMSSAPGGGGAGGTILVESPQIELGAMGALVANGGGGGGGNGNPGAVSDLSANSAPGGMGTSGYGGGGLGGANNFLPGNPGLNGVASTTGGGSGGTAGRVVILNLTGTLSAPSAIISPQLGTPGTSGQPAAFVGSIDLQ
jgi:hypothetical protein